MSRAARLENWCRRAALGRPGRSTRTRKNLLSGRTMGMARDVHIRAELPTRRRRSRIWRPTEGRGEIWDRRSRFRRPCGTAIRPLPRTVPLAGRRPVHHCSEVLGEHRAGPVSVPCSATRVPRMPRILQGATSQPETGGHRHRCSSSDRREPSHARASAAPVPATSADGR